MKQKIEVIRGICNICLDKIYFNELDKLSNEDLKEEIKAGISLLKSYIEELEELEELK